MTDVVDEGRWHLDGEDLVAEMANPNDVPAHFTLRLVDDTVESAALAGEHPWELVDAERETLDTDCAFLEGRTWWDGP